jgi:nicotinamide riboside kinase
MNTEEINRNALTTWALDGLSKHGRLVSRASMDAMDMDTLDCFNEELVQLAGSSWFTSLSVPKQMRAVDLVLDKYRVVYKYAE